MGTITRLTPGSQGFVLALTAGIFSISQVKIKHVEDDTDESAPEKVTYTTEDGQTFDGTCVFDSPESVARDLVARYTASIPVNAAFTVGEGAPLTVGATTQAKAETAGGTWNSSNPAAATIDSNGNITAIAPGTTIITYVIANADPASVTSVTLSVVTAS